MTLEKQRSTFLGGGMASPKEYSDKTAQGVDDYIKQTLNERYEIVCTKLELYKGAVERMTQELLDIEVLEKDRVQLIIKEFEQENGIVRTSDSGELHAGDEQVISDGKVEE
jgi:cell division protease FtsH